MNGIQQVDPEMVEDLPHGGIFEIQFAGYVAQSYIQKTSKGEKRAVAAYDAIMRKIPKTIKANFIDKLGTQNQLPKYEIGSIPNLYSLIPMAQSAHKPIFALKAKDGVRGAHFNKVREAGIIYEKITSQLIANLAALAK